MDEEEELDNTLIGKEEEAPAVNTGDALMGSIPSDNLVSLVNATGQQSDAMAQLADTASSNIGVPMTGVRPIDPTTGQPLSQRVIDAASRIGLDLPQASIPLPQLPPAAPALPAVSTDQPKAVVSPFLQSPDTPSGLGGPLLRGFEMSSDASPPLDAPMEQDATRAALGGMTLNEYLNAPAGTPGVSGLRTDPQGRMVPNIAQFQAQPEVAQPVVDSAAPSATTQPPVDALSSFEQDSLARQQRIGGTGSFAGDSQAMQERLRANQRQPGESQADRDNRVAQSKNIGGQTEGLSFEDARRRARGQLAGRNPSASDINSLARAIQVAEPERLAELETKRAKDAADLKTAQATLDRPEFEGKVYTVNGVTFAQTSRGGAQVIDTGAKTPEQSTAQIQNFAFTLEQIDKAREAYSAGNADRANDILTAAGIQKNGIDVTANEYFGDFTPQVTPPGSTPQVTDTGFTQQQEANIQKVLAANPNSTRADVVEAMEKAGKL